MTKRASKSDDEIRAMFSMDEEEWLSWGTVIETSRGEWHRTATGRWIFRKRK